MDKQPNSYQYNSSQENNSGCVFFVLVLLAITSLIYFPSLTRHTSSYKSRESEARMYVGSMNRAQQAYYLEKSTFASSIDQLGIGIKSNTDNYKYLINSTSKSSFHYAVPHHQGYLYRKNGFGPFQWYSKSRTQAKTYIGAVFVISLAKGETTTATIVCRATPSNNNLPAKPTYKDGKLACGSGTEEINRSST